MAVTSRKKDEIWTTQNRRLHMCKTRWTSLPPLRQGMEKALLLSILQQDTITDEQYEQCIRLLNHKNMPVFTDE